MPTDLSRCWPWAAQTLPCFAVDLLIFLVLVGAPYILRKISLACDMCLQFDLLWFW